MKFQKESVVLVLVIFSLFSVVLSVSESSSITGFAVLGIGLDEPSLNNSPMNTPQIIPEVIENPEIIEDEKKEVIKNPKEKEENESVLRVEDISPSNKIAVGGKLEIFSENVPFK